MYRAILKDKSVEIVRYCEGFVRTRKAVFGGGTLPKNTNWFKWLDIMYNILTGHLSKQEV